MLINFNQLKTFYNALTQKMKGFRGNWNQNDPTADDYIKNRTHWEETIQGKFVLVSEMTVNISDDGGYQELSNSVKLTAGEKYTVILNGVTYECVARSFNEDTVIIGNGVVYGDGIKGNDEPFSCDNYSDGTIYLNVATAGTYTISIYSDETRTIVHKLDKKFIDIPDGLVTEEDVINIAENTLAPVAFTNSYNSLSGKPTIYTDVVRYVNQSLTNTEKKVARNNIGAVSSEELNTLAQGSIRHDIKQSLSDTAKSQARDNINVYSKEETYDKTEETSCIITWDGDTANKDSFNFSFSAVKHFYKVADITFNADDVVSISSVSTDSVSDTDDFFGDGVRKLGRVIVASKTGDCRLYNNNGSGTWADIAIPSAGIYFERSSSPEYYVESATITHKARTIPIDVIGITRTINNIEPDTNGNVALVASDIGATTEEYVNNAVAQKSQVQIITWGADD